MWITAETIGGDTITIAVAHVTHLTQTALGTQVYFSSGEQLIVKKPIGELTLDLAQASA